MWTVLFPAKADGLARYTAGTCAATANTCFCVEIHTQKCSRLLICIKNIRCHFFPLLIQFYSLIGSI